MKKRWLILAMVGILILVGSIGMTRGPFVDSETSADNILRTITYWYDLAWHYRTPINITNSYGSNLSNYQVKVTMNTSQLVAAGKMQPNGSDIRFTSQDKMTSIPYWIESGINTTSTVIWVKVPSITTGSSTIYIYYNNPNATANSSIANTFSSGSFSDTFDDNSKINLTDSVNITVTGGEVRLSQALQGSNWVQTSQGDFEAGVLNQVDTSSSPGDVKLAVASSWFNTSWSRRAPVTINNAGSVLTDYQVKVDVTYDSDMQPDFDDIRFTASDGSTSLSYWRDSYTASTSAVFWVNVTSVPAGNSTIYMYYGNSGVSSTSSGADTFTFFDNFPGTSVDTGKWDIMHSSYVSVSGGTLKLSGGNLVDTDGGIWTTDDFGTSYVVTMRAYLVDRYPAFAWFVQANNQGYIEWIWDADYLGYLYKLTFGEPSSFVYLNTGGANAYVFNTWSTIDIKISGSDYDLYQDGNLKSSYSHSDLSGGGIGLEQWGGGPSEYDWILVRKYASPEPTASVGSEEGKYVSSGTLASQVYNSGAGGTSWNELSWEATTTGSEGGWYNASWSRRAAVTINNSGSALNDYQVKVDVTHDGDMQPDFDDIRFTDDDGTTPLSYWRETYTANTSSVFWVNVTSVPAGDSTIYMYYGNSGVSSTSSGADTFTFFDNFPGTSVDTGKWDIMHSSYVSVSGGTLKLSGGNSVDTDGGIWTTDDFGTSYVVTMRAYLVDRYPAFAWFVQANNQGYIEWIWDADYLGYLYKLTFGEPSSSVYLNAGGTNVYVFNTWSTIDIKISGSDYDLYQDGNLKSSYSHSDLSGGGIGLEQWGGGPSEYDWILVRKYASPEPTASVGSTDITFEVRASDTSFNKADATPSWTDLGSADSLVNLTPYNITGRYFQWRATLSTTATWDTPTLHDVTASYSYYSYVSSGTVRSVLVPQDTATRFAIGGNLSWNDTEPASSDIKYQLEYYDGGWQLVPDGDLPGNSAGFDDSPVDISSMNTTYGQIRLRGNLSTSDDRVTPSVQDWQVTYYYREYVSPEPTTMVGGEE